MTDMTDDPMQDPTVLASAYLDGEVTPDERARAESSPDVMAEVEQLRQIRSVVMNETEPAALSVREAQLAAALDVFDQLGPNPTAAAGTASLASRRARRARRSDRPAGERSRLLLGTAAGLLVVAGAGAVIRGVIVGSNADDDSANAVEDAEEELAEQSAELGPAESDVLAEVQGDNTGNELRTEIDPGEVATDIEADDLPEAESAQDATVAVEAPAEEPAEAPADESAPADDEAIDDADVADDAGFDEDAATSPEDAPPEADLVELLTPQDLADFAAPAAYAPATQQGADIDDLICGAEPPAGLGIDRLAEFAFVAGELVNVGVDLETGLAFAFRDDCTVVLDAILPTEDEFLGGVSDVTTTTAAP